MSVGMQERGGEWPYYSEWMIAVIRMHTYMQAVQNIVERLEGRSWVSAGLYGDPLKDNVNIPSSMHSNVHMQDALDRKEEGSVVL
jgi:hypothetical protein